MWDEAKALSKLSDEELDRSAIRAAASERKCMHTVLLHIREVERRRLYAKIEGAGSLYEYVIKRMKYSEGSASRRIAAAHMLGDNPEIAESVQSGDLNLTNLLTLRSTIRAEEKRSGEKFEVEEKRELLSLIANKTQAEVTRELVELFPQAVNLTEKTRMVSGNRLQVSMSLEDDQIKRSERVRELASHINDNFAWSELFDFLVQYYLRQEDPLLQPLSKKRNKAKEKEKEKEKEKGKEQAEEKKKSTAASKDREAASEVKATGAQGADETSIREECRTAEQGKKEGVRDECETERQGRDENQLQNELKVQESEVINERSITQRFDGMALQRAALADEVSSSDLSAELHKQRSVDAVKPSTKTTQSQWVSASERHTRYISVHDKRALHHRSGSRCEWVDPVTGQRCTRRYHLQVDHRTPISKGGTSELSNLQHLCRVHNLWKGTDERRC